MLVWISTYWGVPWKGAFFAFFRGYPDLPQLWPLLLAAELARVPAYGPR